MKAAVVFLRWMRNLLVDCKGATIIEYALLGGLIAAIAAVAVGNVGRGVNTKFTSVSTSF